MMKICTHGKSLYWNRTLIYPDDLWLCSLHDEKTQSIEMCKKKTIASLYIKTFDIVSACGVISQPTPDNSFLSLQRKLLCVAEVYYIFQVFGFHCLLSNFDVRGLFFQHGLTLIPAWIRNHMPGIVWDEIFYPLPNFNRCILEVWEWMSNFIPHFIMDVITYPCWN